MLRSPVQFVKALQDTGFERFCYVPCSILEPIRRESLRTSQGAWILPSVEGEAVAISVGNFLGGCKAAVLMQNSGLGNAVNPLTSLVIPYGVPVLLIISWRGEPNRPDAVHHLPMGSVTLELLNLLGVKTWVVKDPAHAAELVVEANAWIEQENRPAALVVPRGTFDSDQPTYSPPHAAEPRRARPPREVVDFSMGPLPTRADVIAALTTHAPDGTTISTTGYMSRALCNSGRRDNHFYMQGSMGFALAVGLGVTQARPGKLVYVLDGDAALLMRLGCLSTVGAANPAALAHILVDNRCHASTGRQPSASSTVDFPAVALACGYRRAGRCANRDALEDAMSWVQEGEGPTFLHVVIRQEDEQILRPSLEPAEVARRFRASLICQHE